LSTHNKEKFVNDFIYLSVFSLTGGSISLTLSFPEEKTKERIITKELDDFFKPKGGNDSTYMNGAEVDDYFK
jgi:hypothetical protein